MTKRSRRIAMILLGAILLLRQAAPAQDDPPLTQEQVAQIEAILRGAMEQRKIPGLSFAIVRNLRIAWSAGLGVSDLARQTPAQAETVYRLASLSKPITAVAAMQLAEQGRLDLDAPVQKYVPAFPEKAWRVTTRQLLGHLGGIRHYRKGEMLSARHYNNLTEALSIFKDDPLALEPGTRYLYSTYGYNLIGSVVEGASGESFLQRLRDHVFRVAEASSLRDDDANASLPLRAQGYRRDAHGAIAPSLVTDTSNKIPGGGLCGNALDIAKFSIALVSGRLVMPQTFERMCAPQRTRFGKSTGYGLGFGIREHRGKTVVQHSGAQPCVSALLYMIPERRFAVVLLCNLEGEQENLTALATEIADTLYARAR